MRSVADGVEPREAVLVVPADEAIYLLQVPFHFGGRKTVIYEMSLQGRNLSKQ